MKLLLISLILALFCSNLPAQTSAFTCPRIESEFYANPDPTQCNTFYQCIKGVAFLQHCPWPLVFHADVNGCDKPLPGECISPNPFCPNDGIQPIPDDCSKFFLCSWGVAKLMICPGTEKDIVFGLLMLIVPIMIAITIQTLDIL